MTAGPMARAFRAARRGTSVRGAAGFGGPAAGDRSRRRQGGTPKGQWEGAGPGSRLPPPPGRLPFGPGSSLVEPIASERKGGTMPNSVYKVIELVGSSTESWEKAATGAVALAAKSLRDLRVAEVEKLDISID